MTKFRVGIGAAVALTICAAAVSVGKAVTSASPTSAKQHLSAIKHIVVIYEENHSFDNLYGGWEGVNGLASADPTHTKQVSQTGAVYSCLQQNDVNLTVPPLQATCNDSTTGTTFASAFQNGPFALTDQIPLDATTCPNPLGSFAAHGFL